MVPLKTCPTCAGRKTTHNPSTHDDNPCGTCVGTGIVSEVRAKQLEADRQRDDLLSRLRIRSHYALDAGDDTLAKLLREAIEAIRKGA